jgi:hypothetical protein
MALFHIGVPFFRGFENDARQFPPYVRATITGLRLWRG